MAQRRNRRSGVEDRWHCSDGSPSVSNGRGLRWRARYVDDNGREHARGFRTKADAKSWLDEVVSSQLTGTYVDPVLGKVTFASFYRDWSSRQIWETGTRHTMDLAANSVTFANVPLSDLRKSHIEPWVKDMQRNGLQPSTIRTRFANVHAAIRNASGSRPRLLADDVCNGVKLPPTRKPSAAMAIPTPDDLGKLIEKADGPFAAFISVCAFAGLRRGEASALRVSDVEFLRRELRVTRQVQWTADGRMELRPPKYGSERTVYIPEGLITILAEYVRIYRPGDAPDRYLFPGSRDANLPAHAATVGRSWRIACASAKLKFRLHDCRHFFASGLIREGCDVVTVQRALGHSSPSVTLDTYGHLWPDASDRTRNAAASLVEQVFGTVADGLRTDAAKTPAD